MRKKNIILNIQLHHTWNIKRQVCATIFKHNIRGEFTAFTNGQCAFERRVDFNCFRTVQWINRDSGLYLLNRYSVVLLRWHTCSLFCILRKERIWRIDVSNWFTLNVERLLWIWFIKDSTARQVVWVLFKKFKSHLFYEILILTSLILSKNTKLLICIKHWFR